ncbi:MAG: prohibitin family protein [Euryarchaeota archaeon]|nr:prohibitin family protein [Euryarchaeota archaeon]
MILKDSHQTRKRKLILKTVGIALAVLFALVMFSSTYVVGAGERAVIYNSLGHGVHPEPVGEGLHFKVPFFSTATTYDVRENLYKTSATSASRDLQEVSTAVAVRYAPEPEWTPWIHQNFGESYASKIIAPGVQESVKSATAQYNAEELITKRPMVKLTIIEALRERLAKQHIILQEMDITDFQFSESFDAAIEAKVTAEQRALEEKNRLEQIRHQAEQRVVQAQAEADAVLIGAEADANRTRMINEQLSVSPLYLRYLWITTWNGELPRFLGGDDVSMLYGIPEEP